MDLEHAIGFNGRAMLGLHEHPVDGTIIYSIGGCVVVANKSENQGGSDQTFLRGHDDLVTCLDVSAGGRYIASGQKGDNADVIIWEYAASSAPGAPPAVEKFRLEEHDLGVHMVRFTSDERFLLTVGMDKKLAVWDMHTGCLVAKTTVKQTPLCACWGGRARDIKGRQTATFQMATGGDGLLTYWIFDPCAGSLVKEECSLGNQVRCFTSLTFSADATYIFAGSSSSDVTAVHVKHKVMHAVFDTKGSSGVHALVAQETDAPGDRLIIGCGNGLITVYEGVRTGAQTVKMFATGHPTLCTQQLDGAVRSLVVRECDPNGRLRVLAGTEHGALYAVELSAPDHRSRDAPYAKASVLQEAHFDRVVAIAYRRDSCEVFATASADAMIRVWDVNNYGVIAKASCQKPQTGEPLCLDFTGEVVYSGWEDGKIRAHAADDGELLWIIDNAHRGGVTALAVAHNRKFLVSGGKEGEMRLWDFRSREMVLNLKQHTDPLTSLKLLPDDSHVYSASRDRTILMWDLRTESRVRYMQQPMGGINAIGLVPPQGGEDWLVSVGQDKRLSSWCTKESSSVATADKDRQGGPPIGEQFCIAVWTTPPPPPPQQPLCLIATGGVGGTVRLWRLQKTVPVCVAVGSAHSATVRSLQFAPDGRQLISVADDGAAIVWNLFHEEFFPELAPQ